MVEIMESKEENAKYKLPKEWIEFLKSMGTAINISDKETWYNLPHWFKIPDDGVVVEIVLPHEMADYLKKQLHVDQELEELQVDYNKLKNAYIQLSETHAKYNKLKEVFDKMNVHFAYTRWASKESQEKQINSWNKSAGLTE